jgi:hypothetical protein
MICSSNPEWWYLVTKNAKMAGKIGLGVMMFVLLLPLAWAQETPGSTPSTSGTSTDVSNAAQSRPSAEDTTENVPAKSASADPLAVSVLGRAGSLSKELGLWHVGSLWLTSADLYESYIVVNDKTVPLVPRLDSYFHLSITSLSFNTAYDKRLSPNSRITLQYQPRVSIINGHTRADLLDQNMAFNIGFRPTARWKIGLSDTFQSYSDLNLNGNNLFYGDPQTGTAIQNLFLNGKAHTYTDAASTTFDYNLSARTQLSFSPNASYTYIKGHEQSAVDLANGQTGTTQIDTRLSELSYGGTVSVNHSLNATRGVGVYYSYERTHINAGRFAGAYNSGGLSYSQEIGHTFNLSAHIGASTYQLSNKRYWTPEAALTAVKSFRSSAVSLAYVRSEGFGGYVTSAFSDRADLKYTHGLGRKIGMSTGVGYFRTNTSLDRNAAGFGSIWGEYATGEVGYVLSRHFRYFLSYTQLRQKGDNFQVSSGTSYMASSGIQWLPARLNKEQY